MVITECVLLCGFFDVCDGLIVLRYFMCYFRVFSWLFCSVVSVGAVRRVRHVSGMTCNVVLSDDAV